MRIIRYTPDGERDPRVGVEDAGGIWDIGVPTVGDLLRLPLSRIRGLAEEARRRPAVARAAILLPPIDGRTEVWAAGVTYRRSRQARMEESVTADVYERVYNSQRPELFFKCAAWRVVTDGEPIGIREDSELNVPEPELGLVANQHAEIVGYVVSNDVSSRTIEGENPLYLPQAKIYAGSSALSDGIRPSWEVPAPTGLDVTLTVTRGTTTRWHGRASTAQLHRPLAELMEYLFRGDHFPEGVVLSTGTGIVPELDFTLHPGDVVTVTVQDVGVLTNTVAVGKGSFGWLANASGHGVVQRARSAAAPSPSSSSQ